MALALPENHKCINGVAPIQAGSGDEESLYNFLMLRVDATAVVYKY